MEKNKSKINLKNIKSFLEGNLQLGLEELGLQPLHIQEQIAYRRLICKDDCAVNNACIKCGCDFKGKTSVKESCNQDRFPDLMSKVEWEQFKQQNDIG
jgi:hypothetical protein